MNIGRMACLASLFVMSAVSCKTVRTQQSEAKHDAGRFLNATDSSLWGQYSQAEYEAVQFRSSYSKMLPVDHELTKRLQFWAETLRVKMIEVMPELAKVPAPQVRILKSESVNAFVQGVHVSFTADIATASAPSLVGDRPLVLGKECTFQCTEFKGNLEDKRLLIEQSQKRINPSCKVELANESFILADSCLSPPGVVYEGPKRFNRFDTYQMLNYVSVLSESIKVMSESDMVVTLAHELAHYYLAHPVYLNVPGADVPYDYLYVKSKESNAGKPVPLPKSNPNYALVKEFDEVVESNFPVLEGQKYPTVLGLAIAESVSDGLNRGGIVDRCVTGTDLKICLDRGYEVGNPARAYTNWVFINSKSDMFSPELVASGTALALKFEEALAKNASMLRASDLITLQKSLAKYIGLSAPVVNLSGDKDETVADFLPSYVEKAKNAIEANPDVVATLTQKLVDAGLGFYTAEQEADDVATEVLYELGFDPQDVVNNWFKFLDRSAEPQAKKESCRANYASGFKTPIWIGQSTEPHHGHCYRAYNAYNEMISHREFFEKNKVPKKPEAPGAAWADLVATMKGKGFIALSTK